MKLAVTGAVVAMATAAFADASGPPEPWPAHRYDASCTLEQRQDATGLCIDCEVEHDVDLEYANYNSCSDIYTPDGFELVCGSEWTEIWCPDDGVDDTGDTSDDGCSATGRNPHFTAQLGLVIGLVLFGLCVRRRFRS